MVLSIAVIFIIFIVLIVTNIDSITNWVNSLFTILEAKKENSVKTSNEFNFDWLKNIGTTVKTFFSNFNFDFIEKAKKKILIPEGYYDHIVLVLPGFRVMYQGLETPRGFAFSYEDFIKSLKLEINRFNPVFDYSQVERDVEKNLKLDYKEIDVDNNLIYLTLSFKHGLKPSYFESTIEQVFKLISPTVWHNEVLEFKVQFPDKKYLPYPMQMKFCNQDSRNKSNRQNNNTKYEFTHSTNTDRFSAFGWEKLNF